MKTKVTVATFNIHNLYSRFNFEGQIAALPEGDAATTTVTHTFQPRTYKNRTYKGKLINGKDSNDTDAVAATVRNMNADVLALQEVEDIDTLRKFNSEKLGGMYRYHILIEGNDPRLIDIALLSKLPIGAVTSWQKAVHPDVPGDEIFGRDLLEVEILNAKRSARLFTIYNNHLKSHFVEPGEDKAAAQAQYDLRRKRQVETVCAIVQSEERPKSPFIIVGDMNDPHDSPALSVLSSCAALGVVNALTNPVEKGSCKYGNYGTPTTTAWTYRYKESKQPAAYSLFDQIWLSPSLASRQTGSWISRRSKLAGNGSDHDPSWVELTI